MRIALYSCNFGNYRNEFINYYNVKFDENIDYFLFTDKKITYTEYLKLGKWNIINTNLLPGDEIMDSFRWTSKYVKFFLPKILRKYEIIIWIDNKRFLINDKLNGITYSDVIKIIDKYPDAIVFNLKHKDRTTLQQELKETISNNIENYKQGLKFFKFLNCYKSSFELVDTCFIIRKNIYNVNKAFENCLRFMKITGLKRDQNMYNYVLDNEKIKPILLNYDDLSFIE
jgi:hypothetical protein